SISSTGGFSVSSMSKDACPVCSSKEYCTSNSSLASISDFGTTDVSASALVSLFCRDVLLFSYLDCNTSYHYCTVCFILLYILPNDKLVINKISIINKKITTIFKTTK